MKICSLFLLFCLIAQLNIGQVKTPAKKVFTPSNCDLIGLITVTPEPIHGPTSVIALIDVIETNQIPTTGPITVYVQKNSSFVDFKFNPTATSIGGSKVHNGNWQFDDTTNPTYYVLTSTNVIPGGAISTIGLTGEFTTNVSGQLGVSMSIETGSGGEINATNNTASTTITYSPQ